MVLDLAVGLGYIPFSWGISRLYRRRWRWIRDASYAATMAALWLACDVGALPASTRLPATALISLAYFLTRHDDDHRPRRRLRSALKRARSWLASGIPARRVTV